LTETFKQPKAKVVAVKQIVKQPPKTKLKRGRPSSEPSSAGAYVERPRNHESLAIARAAKAAKRTATLAEKATQASASSRGAGLKQARKSALIGPISSWKLKHSAPQARPKNALDSDTPDASPVEAEDTDATAPARIVQDTDEEDDDFVPDSTRGGVEEHNVSTSAGVKDWTEISASVPSVDPRRPGRGEARKSASVVAVKKLKKKMGGARPGAGRKRKRPVVFNSDDE
jgi:hypothetical protein